MIELIFSLGLSFKSTISFRGLLDGTLYQVGLYDEILPEIFVDASVLLHDLLPLGSLLWQIPKQHAPHDRAQARYFTRDPSEGKAPQHYHVHSTLP